MVEGRCGHRTRRRWALASRRMIEHHLDIPTADGAMNTFITHPEEGGPHPVVFFYMDAPGKREELHDMARRLGTAGLLRRPAEPLLPSSREFNVFSGDPDQSRERDVRADGHARRRPRARDTAAMFAHVDADPAADSSRVGCVGYCMSGPFSFAMAGTLPRPDQGGRVDLRRPRSSAKARRLHWPPTCRGELYFACAEFDEYAPTEMIDGLEAPPARRRRQRAASSGTRAPTTASPSPPRAGLRQALRRTALGAAARPVRPQPPVTAAPRTTRRGREQRSGPVEELSA